MRDMVKYVNESSCGKGPTQFHSGSQFLAPVKNRRFLRFIHNNSNNIIFIIIINFFIRVFSEFTEAVAASLIPLVTNFPEIYAFF